MCARGFSGTPPPLPSRAIFLKATTRYMDTQYRGKDEMSSHFAARVKEMIALQARLESVCSNLYPDQCICYP